MSESKVYGHYLILPGGKIPAPVGYVPRPANPSMSIPGRRSDRIRDSELVFDPPV